MRTSNHPRDHWAWWLLAIALVVAWLYLPDGTLPGSAPSVAHGPAPSQTSNRASEQPAAKAPSPTQPVPDARLPASLPHEARDTIALIQRGGPFPYRQDGGVFNNREGVLPRKPRGWYREYTVDTPGLSHRGARRIITGGNPPYTWHYTSDHYNSFLAFNPGTASGISP